MKTFYILLAVQMFLNASCGSKDSGSSDPAPQGTESVATTDGSKSATALDGTFESACRAISGVSYKHVATNTATKSIYTQYQYSDEACQKGIAVIVETRSWVVGVTGDTRENGVNGVTYYPVDVTYEKIEVTLLDASLVGKNLYGVSDWKLNEAKDVTGKVNSSVKLSDKGQVSYQVSGISIDAKNYVMELSPWSLPAGEGQDKDHRSNKIVTAFYLTKK